MKIKKSKAENKDPFAEYEQEVARSVAAAQKRIKEEKEKREYVDFESYPAELLKREVFAAIKKDLGAPKIAEVELAVPPPHAQADFALAIFNFVKGGENPNALAQKIANEINNEKINWIKEAVAKAAFVNLKADERKLYPEILAKIIMLGKDYGESGANAGKTVLLDYSAPNIAKPIGVGHLRSTIIGEALANLYRATGYSVIRDNHLGDWGTQFGSLIYAYQKWGDPKKVAKDPIRELKNLYVQFHKFAKNNPEIKEKGREIFCRLEKKDPKLAALWKQFRDLSLNDFNQVYERLGISFDTNIGESYFTKQADLIVRECLKKGVCYKDKKSEAIVADAIEKLPSFLLRKQDGSSLYLSRDLATLQFRVSAFSPDAILYVVGNEQELHFRQLFAFAKIAGYLPEKVKAKHIGFGMVLSGGKKMSTRGGTLIELEELFNQAKEKSKEISQAKNPEASPEELENLAEIIGLGAIIYNDLSQSRNTNIAFDWEKMLSLEGSSAIYLQYSYVRVQSILKKIIATYGEISANTLKKEEMIFADKSEFALAKKLMLFPEVIAKAQKNNSPHYVCVYLEELAQSFNSFYNAVSILKTEERKLRNSRIALISAVALVIKKGLGLLSIKAPEKM